MKILRTNILSKAFACMLSVAFLAAGGCNDKEVVTRVSQTKDSGDMTISGSLALSSQSVMSTRGALDDTPGANLKLTIFEFDLGENTDQSFLSNIYKAEINSQTNVENEGIVNFSFTLQASAKPKVLHLVVADEYKTWSFAPVADILSALTVGEAGNETEAYWGRVEFPNGYNEMGDDGKFIVDENNVPMLRSDVKEKLTKVPVIRNFAKIRVSVADDVENFELLGFDVVNVPTSGTIAPWNQESQSIPVLLDADNKMKTYNEVSEVYSGILPGNVSYRNTESVAKTWNSDSPNMNNSQDVYMYEHPYPYDGGSRTYLIVHGIYKSTVGNVTTETKGFYKLDIGKTNAQGEFNYYNIIRNIEYNVVITAVATPGSSSVTEAIQRAPFNNVFASTETSAMLNVSDGQNMLVVNDTNHVIVSDTEKVEVLFRYITGLDKKQEEVHNDYVHFIGLTEGQVIQSYYTESYTDPSGAVWEKIVITPHSPTSTVVTQDFTIIDDNGLSRKIHLILRNPWQYAPLKNADGSDSKWTASVAPGISNSFPFTQTVTTPDPQIISSNSGEPLTVYFNLPDGLPESMFPLDFYLEAKYQGIENNKIGTLLVTSGPSLFPDNDKVTIQYIKSVSYNEYKYQYEGDGQTDIDFSKINVDHTIRCRFLTIIEEKVDNAEIIIHNPYFSPDTSVTFARE